MSKLVKIASWKGRSRASVVFVHGLGGHPYKTWRRGEDDDTFWPIWLAEDLEGIKVYSLSYEAPVSNWLGTSMPLQDRATNILELLLSEQNLKSGPIVFVCHSLGGLIVKKVILSLKQQSERRPEAADMLDRISAVVFAATPHTGSRYATWLDRLSFLLWPSTVTRVLVSNDPSLREINVAYRGLADDRRRALRHLIFYETLNTRAGGIVDEASSDPGLPGDPPVPVDADHISIVKPVSRTSLFYACVKQFVERIPAVGETLGSIDRFILPAIASESSWNITPKLARVSALLFVAVVGFKGAESLIFSSGIGRRDEPRTIQLVIKDKQIAQLVALLEERRTAPAPPDANMQLKEAVSAIEKGSGSDTRYAQALELLKAGRPAEAEPLLKAVADDKARELQDKLKELDDIKSRLDAIAAYRNLATVAAISDTARASKYYAVAAELDPKNNKGPL